MNIPIKEFKYFIQRLRDNGWDEWIPSITYWTFYKRHFKVSLNWYTGDIIFTNLLRKDNS